MQRSKGGYKFIDLFAGIGGMRLGFESNGFQCLFSSEWDKYAQITYQGNFNELPAGDITQINVEDIPSHNLLVAGFPCQPFSKAGKGLGLHDSRGHMFFEIQRILEFHRPDVLLLENVRQLYRHDDGKTYELIRGILEGDVSALPRKISLKKSLRDILNFDLDYKIYPCVLNSKDYGLPQSRERLYIVGFRKKISQHKKFKFSWPNPLNVKTRVGDILQSSSLISERYALSDTLWTGHKRRKAGHKAKGNGFGYGLVARADPYTRTLSARYWKDGSEILVCQEHLGLNPRKLTPRECANLQGFPKDYKIGLVSATQMYKQFGNSVAVPVISAISKEILKSLNIVNGKII